MLRYKARGEFGEHERGVRIARGVPESNSSLLRFEDCAKAVLLSHILEFILNNYSLKSR